jgi:hypothetical protein
MSAAPALDPAPNPPELPWHKPWRNKKDRDTPVFAISRTGGMPTEDELQMFENVLMDLWGYVSSPIVERVMYQLNAKKPKVTWGEVGLLLARVSWLKALLADIAGDLAKFDEIDGSNWLVAVAGDNPEQIPFGELGIRRPEHESVERRLERFLDSWGH